MEDADGIVKEVSYHSVNFESIGGGNSGSKTDLTDVILRHERLAKNRSKEIRAEIWQLTEELETIERIWCCYTSLQGKAASYIRQLYVEKIPYKVVEQDSKLSHKRFDTIRATAMKDMKHLYHSELSNQEIIMFRHCEKKKNLNLKDYGQLKMEFK